MEVVFKMAEFLILRYLGARNAAFMCRQSFFLQTLSN